MSAVMYDNYEQALSACDFFAAIELLKDHLNQKPHATMEWYWLGYALMCANLYAEAGIYLRRALLELDAETPLTAQTAEIYVTKASVYALLQEKDICLRHIHTALWLKPSLIDSLLQDITLQKIFQPEDWQNITATQNARYYTEQLVKAKWEIIARTPKKMSDCEATYHLNIYWLLHLSYNSHLHQVSLAMQNKEDETDKHLFHFRPIAHDFNWLTIIFEKQSIITHTQWSILSEALIEVCDNLIWEMPDGRRIKIG